MRQSSLNQRSLFEEAEMRQRDPYKRPLVDFRADRRKALIAIARAMAENLARLRGTVTSSDVLFAMKSEGVKFGTVDPRFMGAVFRGKAWERVGYINKGSHRRPVSVWRRA